VTGGLRIGHGIDAHRLIEGLPLMLGGIHVPYGEGLLGHSDGDCVVHALADAVLAAAGRGDIGRHFPSTDPRWKGVAGLALLHEVARIIDGADLLSASVVIVAEEPKLAPYVDEMSKVMCDALGVSEGTVRVSATSTDGLGFAGVGDGISASAVALVSQSS
jgi:2-C-methyl-D-erythritol 2,4-cyclodiphosphate synthase